ncbi:ABC transporter substrate-binding protein [Arsenicitalea aurantiaca]|uniref:ABC transporter substrate-binding protein n=1 Tax=Arsenicitalea aurantiaca TaxID=1783274 RepID=A0A433X429_9HYPH|nr:extracellular solute-binding protein [Arsenicitalea aurantiaca]RUT28812.1 ABC transporter substrate-binding protein [Arsenicitalea aurantiaca]
MKPLSRLVLALGATLALTGPLLSQEAAPPPDMADEAHADTWLFGTSLIDEPKYAEGFPHFDYVNPDAPKGGVLRLSASGGFDTFNPILPAGEPAAGLGLVYETLMTSSLDEVSTQYGLIAEAFRYPADYSSVTFRLDPDARWHDGEPVTAEDVKWSFEKMVELNPNMANYYQNVVSAEVTGEREVTFTFDEAGNRELPHIMGQVLVMPQHWWEGTGANGQQRNIGASTLEPPLGSGPYRIARFTAGRSVAFERVEDYWGADKPVNVGTNNFNEMRYTYYRDETVRFEAFKGDQFDFWQEAIARRWATGYEIPAVTEGRIIRETYENPFRSSGILFGFVPNLRLEKFQDPRVREALNYAYDFETLNQTLFYEQYRRIDSYFFGTELASSGLPEGEELEILESVRDLVPESVFTEVYTNPVGGDQTQLRANLREALRLFSEAGYTLEGNRLVDANGQQFGFEILIDNPILEPMITAFQTNLQAIGINATIRTLAADPAQYLNRLRSRDFEMVYERWGQSLSPGNEQRFMWGSSSAEGDSSNYLGVADPGIDQLINRVIFADDRETLIAATRALDRVLLHNHFVVPTYTAGSARIAYWNRFSHPEELPEYAIGFPSIWWYDDAKAAATGGR